MAVDAARRLIPARYSQSVRWTLLDVDSALPAMLVRGADPDDINVFTNPRLLTVGNAPSLAAWVCRVRDEMAADPSLRIAHMPREALAGGQLRDLAG